jgi:diguanylate cyclase (GGDEF)-like protein/PAS domain S-box-containing protein
MRPKDTGTPATPIVLLIEDERGDAELIRWQLLERHDEPFSVHMAESLAAAQQLIDGDGLRPDVVLLDLNLPDSSGPQTVKRCRALTGAPIVVLTGLDDETATQATIESGAEDYLCKGGDGSTLRRAIRYAMLRRRRDADARLAASVFSTALEGIMITEADGTIINVNDAFTRITGYSHEEAIGRNPRFLSAGRQSPESYAAMWGDLQEKGHWRGETWNRRKNGEVYAEMQNISSVPDPGGGAVHYVSLFSDITSIKDYQKQLEHIAHFDALTGLPNRVLLADRLRQAMARTQRQKTLVAVAFLDLDGFKAVNDNHGHEAGDQLLISLAARMRDGLRESDTLARIGGDEFVAVLVDLNGAEECLPMLNRVLAAAAEPVSFGGNLLQVSASLGVTFYPQQEEIDADQLQRQADQAMYQAKLGGKNRYHLFDAASDGES